MKGNSYTNMAGNPVFKKTVKQKSRHNERLGPTATRTLLCMDYTNEWRRNLI